MAIPTKIIRNLEEEGTIRSMNIDLSDSAEDRAAIIEVLRSKLYSNKILAPIREYSTNAFDSHVEAGCPNTPIEVTLPTMMFPEFKIRDFGIGLTPEEVEQIYIKYGRSTKRNTNAQTGQLGLGCKSAFAYGDNFVVTSFKDGIKSTYTLSISGVATLATQEPMTSDEKVGIEVTVPVNIDDVDGFQRQALNFFKYWKVTPVIHGGDIERIDELRKELEIKPLFHGDDWEIRPGRSGYYSGSDNDGIAVMGNVPYPIDWDQVHSKMKLDDKESVLFDFIRANKAILYVSIGTFDFSASRESLEFTEKTCKAITRHITKIIGSIFDILDTKIKSSASYWEALLTYTQIFGRGDEQLFKGDIHRLETYYKGKFSWNGVKIVSGSFEHIERWDNVLGFSEEAKWKNEQGVAIEGANPVMTVHTIENRRGRNRFKENYPSSYQFNSIPATTKNLIVINDLEKPILTKATVRYLFTAYKQPAPGRIHVLRFKDDAQKKHFYDTLYFESAPVIYMSQIINGVRTWLKSQRQSNDGNGPTGEPQPVRCIKIANRIDRWGSVQDIGWDRNSIDMHEEEGYYVELSGNYATVGDRQPNLGYISHNANTLFKALDEKVDYVYGFPLRTLEAKWFEEAKKTEQWVKLEDYFKANQDRITHGKGALLATAAKYFDYAGEYSNYNLGIKFCEKIKPLLTNQDGPMAKVCVEVTKDLNEMKQLAEALNFFKLETNQDDCDVDFKKLFSAVKKAYPMIELTDNYRYIRSNDRDYDSNITDSFVKKLAAYINMVDSQSKPEIEVENVIPNIFDNVGATTDEVVNV
jgi:hypothetical protein